MQPPLQIDHRKLNSNVVFSNSIASFRFANAKICEKGILEITTTVPCEGPMSEIGVPFTQNVEREYLAQVPYTTVEDGKTVTRYREEEMTEVIAVTRIRPKAAVDANVKPEVLEQAYGVIVPYTEVDNNGVEVQRSRVEVRKRFVFDDELVPEVVADLIVQKFAIENLECFDRDGKPMGVKQLNARFKNEMPVILINDSKFVSPYFNLLLNEDATFIVEPKVEIRSNPSRF